MAIAKRCYVLTDPDTGNITGASATRHEGYTRCEIDITDWKLFDGSIPRYRLSKSGLPVRRPDAEIKRDRNRQP